MLKNLKFGQLLEKLLYLSNQKKYTLANELGYDVSYISKWVSSKNLPTSKNINKICNNVANFIVDSSTESSLDDIISYFEIDVDEYDKMNSLKKYIEENLKYTYLSSAGKSNYQVYKNTQVEENYNSIVHVNPKLRKKYLSQDIISYATKSEQLDLIVVSNLYNLNNNDKASIAEMKKEIAEIQNDVSVKIRMIIDLNRNLNDLLYNTMLILNILSEYPELDFSLYNCEVDSNTVVAVVKDRLFHSAIFSKSNRYLFTTMSKEKDVVDEVYYTLEDMIDTTGNLICKREDSISLIKSKLYMQYIIGRDLKWLVGTMNEFFMPIELFEEIVEKIFKDDEYLKSELKKINLLLHNITYKSKIKVILHELEIRKYISTGKIHFLNIPIKLTFKQREAHIEYLEKVLKENENIQIKLVDGKVIEEFNNSINPSLYLCNSLKMIKMHPKENINDYLIIKDRSFADICEKVFDMIWEYDTDVIISDREEIKERIVSALNYTKIISENFE